jgi:hypothetical protein
LSISDLQSRKLAARERRFKIRRLDDAGDRTESDGVFAIDDNWAGVSPDNKTLYWILVENLSQQSGKYHGTVTTDGEKGCESIRLMLASNSAISLFPRRPFRMAPSEVMRTMRNVRDLTRSPSITVNRKLIDRTVLLAEESD